MSKLFKKSNTLDQKHLETAVLERRFIEDDNKRERIRKMEGVKGLQELYKLHREFGIGNIFVGDHIDNPDLVNMIEGQDDIMINDGVVENTDEETLMPRAINDDDNEHANEEEEPYN